MKLKYKINTYVYSLFTLSIIGSLLTLHSAQLAWKGLLPLLLLALASEVFKTKIKIYNSREQVAVSWTLVLAIGTFISLGVNEAILLNTLSALVCSVYPKRLSVVKVMYNISANASTIIIVYILDKIITPYFQGDVVMFRAIIIAMAYVMINYALSVILMKILTLKPYKDIMLDIISIHLTQSIILGFIGAFLGISYLQYKLLSVVFCLILIIIVIYSLKATTDATNNRVLELEERNEKIKMMVYEKTKTLEEFIEALAATIDARDPYVYGHSRQVSNYALALAIELNLSEEEIEHIKIAGLLHDIGKISISEAILNKSGRLTNEEFSIIKKHPVIGEEIFSQISSFKEETKLVGMHHERYDGKGYPRGLKGDEVPLGGYILAVADTLDAILSDRSYKSAQSVDFAINEIQNCSGTQFHPHVVDALLNLQKSLGNDVFKNSAILIDQSIITGKVKSRANLYVEITAS
jgi:putative nucleotidyltransferase with HDIG domain